MKKAQELYNIAKSKKTKLEEEALEFYKECIKHCEEEAEEGYFCTRIHHIPEELLEVFYELIVPLFENEGFEIKKVDESPYLNSWYSSSWEVSWRNEY